MCELIYGNGNSYRLLLYEPERLLERLGGVRDRFRLGGGEREPRRLEREREL